MNNSVPVSFLRTINFSRLSFFLFTIFILHSRESNVSLCFGRYVRTRLGVGISEMSGQPVFNIKAGRPVKYLAQGQNKRTCRLVLHNLFQMPSAKQGSYRCHF